MDYKKKKKRTIEILGENPPNFKEILTDEALDFVAQIQEQFGDCRVELLNQRKKRQNDENESFTKILNKTDVKERNICYLSSTYGKIINEILNSITILNFPDVNILIEKPKNKDNGDIATNVAFQLAKKLKMMLMI